MCIRDRNKTIRKKVREDIRTFNESTAKQIIESTWSTRKVKRALTNGIKLFPKLKDDDGKEISDRLELVEVATKFYRSLYSDNRPTCDHPPPRQDQTREVSQIPPSRKMKSSKL